MNDYVLNLKYTAAAFLSSYIDYLKKKKTLPYATYQLLHTHIAGRGEVLPVNSLASR